MKKLTSELLLSTNGMTSISPEKQMNINGGDNIIIETLIKMYENWAWDGMPPSPGCH